MNLVSSVPQPRGVRHPLLVSVIITTVVACCWAAPAHGKLCTHCIHDLGLDTFYTHNPGNCNGNPRDPINVAWFDYMAAGKIAGEVAYTLTVNSNFAWGQEPSTDLQGIRNLYFQCGNEALDVATGPPIAPSRNHARIFNTYTQTNWFAVGDAHHDTGPGYCHGSSDFDGPKRDIYQYFHRAKRYDNWGNTRPTYQSCIHQATRSNGWTAVMQANP